MPIPEFLVTVKAVRFTDLPTAVTSADHTYGRVTIGSRVFGRSRKITAPGSFDLTAERELWQLDVPAESSTNIPVAFEIIDDRGDTAPKHIANGNRTLTAPFVDGDIQVTASTGPKLVLTLTVLRARAAIGPARPTRSPSATGSGVVLRPPRAVTLHYTEIKGLNKPGHDPGGLTRPLRRAEPNPGYFSGDDQGRIYIDSDLNGNWSRDRQVIELAVKVNASGVSVSGSKVQWTIIDPDDPFNDQTHVHQEAGRYIDPNDYDPAGIHIGQLGGDNIRAYNEAGNGTERSIFDRLPPWVIVSGFALSDATNTSAKTALNGSLESKVSLHCPDVGGTNLIVKAELVPTPAGVPMISAQTGIMTMWKRLDVEVARMDQAFALTPVKLTTIADEYEAAFVQLDFHPEHVMSPAPRDSPDEIATNEDLVEGKTNAWIRRAFIHRRDPGWFFLGIAKRGHPPVPKSPPLFDSNNSGASWTHGVSRGRGCEFVEVNTRITAKVESVKFQWDHPNTTGGGTSQVEFFWYVWKQVRRASSTKLFLLGHDITSGFTGHNSNGSVTHATRSSLHFFPRGIFDRRDRPVAGRSYDVPVSGANQARILVDATSPGEIAGISPGPTDFFAGKTVVFSHHPGYADHGTSGAPNVPPIEKLRFADRITATVTHEFAHAFGMPHKCGFWDFKTPRKESCCMNYFSHWLLVPGTTNELAPFFAGVLTTENLMGASLCARHAMEIRRVHLKRNRGLRWP